VKYKWKIMSYNQIEVKLLDWFPKQDGDKQVAHAAWASSFDYEKLENKSFEDVSRVVNQVVDHHHDTPKETVWMNFFIRAPIFCERQFDKYRMTIQQQDITVEYQEGAFGRHGITQNELSGRYRTMPERFYDLPQDVDNIIREVTNELFWYDFEDALEDQYNLYKKFLDKFPEDWKKRGNPNNHKYKRAREVLRGILGTSYLTDWRMMLNLNAFEHIMNQRLAEDTQMESRVLAYRMYNEVVNNRVADVAVQKMTEVNNWEYTLAYIKGFIGE
jgi:thymidylate synthase ThyX